MTLSGATLSATALSSASSLVRDGDGDGNGEGERETERETEREREREREFGQEQELEREREREQLPQETPSGQTTETNGHAAGHPPPANGSSHSMRPPTPTPTPTAPTTPAPASVPAQPKPPPTSLLVPEEVVAWQWNRGLTVKNRTPEEAEVGVRTAARITQRLSFDQHLALHPDVDTPFRDTLDVVRRLLPYHVYQHPFEDLGTRRKGKGRATEEDVVREEIAETRFALECWRRRRALERRFRRARVSSGKRTGSDDQAYWLAHVVVEADRAETAALNAELRAAKQELDKLEREKRAAVLVGAAPASTTMTTSPAGPAGTGSAGRRPYYPPQAAPAYSTAYRNYTTYSYTQGYNTPYGYTPYTTNGQGTYATPGRAAGQTATATTPVAVRAAVGATGTATAAAAAVEGTAGSRTGPIPITLPSTSLAALAALGIVPVAASAGAGAGAAAVVKGTTNDGATVSLEINVGALQPAQLNGLAFVLSALTGSGGSGSSGGGSGGGSSTAAGS